MGNLAAVSDYMSNGYIAQRDASNGFGIASLGPGRPAVAACAAWASAALVTLTPERLGLRGRAQARACRTRPRLPAISPRVWASPAALPLRPCLPQGSRAPTDRAVPARSRASFSSSCTTTVPAETAPPISLFTAPSSAHASRAAPAPPSNAPGAPRTASSCASEALRTIPSRATEVPAIPSPGPPRARAQRRSQLGLRPGPLEPRPLPRTCRQTRQPRGGAPGTMLWGDKTNDMSALVSAVSGSAFGAGAQGSSGGQTTAIMVQRGFVESGAVAHATAAASRTFTMGVDPLEDAVPPRMVDSFLNVVTFSADLAARTCDGCPAMAALRWSPVRRGLRQPSSPSSSPPMPRLRLRPPPHS